MEKSWLLVAQSVGCVSSKEELDVSEIRLNLNQVSSRERQRSVSKRDDLGLDESRCMFTPQGEMQCVKI